MDLPVFALHTVLFPAQRMVLRVFEERYLLMMEDVLPLGPFVVVAIRKGQEVGGPYEANRVGVTVEVEDYDLDPDGSYRLRIIGRDRVALIAKTHEEPFPTWQVEPFPDEGGAGTDDVEAAFAAMLAYLQASGDWDTTPSMRRDPVSASYTLAAATPGLLPQRQALLEVPGAGERLHMVRETFRRETALMRALGAGVGGTDLDVNPN
jgi:Lon protease-like protein